MPFLHVRMPFLYTRIGILVVSIFSSAFVLANPAIAATHPPVPATPHALPRAIEPLADYVPQSACDPVVRPGTRELAELLARTYRAYDATDWSSTYACGTDGDPSEHYEGRAIDWMVDIHNKKQHAAALAAIHWLLGTDSAGNKDAMARRLGVMYLIYNNRIWGAWDSSWQPYDNCAHRTSPADDNACHRTHIHISLSWNGAMGQTSFWTDKVSATNYGPCRPRDLNWAPRYTGRNDHPCAQYPAVKAGAHASSTKKALVEYSGAFVHHGSTGPVVTAVQRGLNVSATGTYGAQTVARVKQFQTRRHLTVTGRMNQGTWRTLLVATD